VDEVVLRILGLEGRLFGFVGSAVGDWWFFRFFSLTMGINYSSQISPLDSRLQSSSLQSRDIIDGIASTSRALMQAPQEMRI